MPANSDDRIKEVLNTAKGLFSDLQKSPYRERIFVVLDSVHSASLPQQLVKMGLPEQNIIKWSKNGIEFFYPPELLDVVYGGGGSIEINGDSVRRNGTEYTKVELALKIVGLLTPDTAMHPEFSEKFLKPLEALIGTAAANS